MVFVRWSLCVLVEVSGVTNSVEVVKHQRALSYRSTQGGEENEAQTPVFGSNPCKVSRSVLLYALVPQVVGSKQSSKADILHEWLGPSFSYFRSDSCARKNSPRRPPNVDIERQVGRALTSTASSHVTRSGERAALDPCVKHRLRKLFATADHHLLF
jgi:hypothetical protein